MILFQTFNVWNNKLVGSIKSTINKDENGENVPRLDITEVVLIHRNIANNNYQQDSSVLYTFGPNELFRLLLDISPNNKIKQDRIILKEK